MLYSVYARFCVSGMGPGNVRVYIQSALSESNLHKLNGRLGRGRVCSGPLLCIFLFFALHGSDFLWVGAVSSVPTDST